MYHLLKYECGVRKSKSWLWHCECRFSICSSINLSVQLEKFAFNITHSRSEIEWSGLLKCLATGSPLMLSLMLFCDCSFGD